MVRVIVPLFATTLFTASFLMFVVEPMIARQLLPVLGGAPMVWNACVVFFQAALLLGYGAAHLLTRHVHASVRLLLYGSVALVPLALVHPGVDTQAAAHATDAPLAWLLVTLASSVGPSFLILAVSASVLQSSLAASRHRFARDPYFLYVASNAGSLAALIVYPSLVEPRLGLATQTRLWTTAYGLFVVLTIACAAVMLYAMRGRSDVRAPEPRVGDTEVADAASEMPITWRDRARWCVLASVPSSLLLGVTTWLTTDLAPIPLLWVVPLALYLLTFVLAFSRFGPPATRLANGALPPALLVLLLVLLLRLPPPIGLGLLLHLAPFFIGAMLCHGQLARIRPSSRHLTEFYFWLAFGGMAGGLFNTLLAPRLFASVLEYPIALALTAALRLSEGEHRRPRLSVDVWLPVAAAVFVVALAVLPWTPEHLRFVLAGLSPLVVLTMARRNQRWTFAAVVAVLAFAIGWVTPNSGSTLLRRRTFFGTYVVRADGSQHRVLTHGTTVHGMQSLDDRRRNEPLTYYHRTGPFGMMMSGIPQLRQPGQIAAVGLGVGTLAAYREPGQQWTFYEIDPAVEQIARDDRLFTFLEECGTACHVVLGDARLSLASGPDVRYQLIAIDAFSSDAIPMHLLTNQAMQVYLARLAPHGVLAFHVSNRHLQLAGVVARLAASNGLFALDRLDEMKGPAWPDGKTASEWVVMARSRADLGTLPESSAWSAPPASDSTPLWTDDFSSIWRVIRFGSI
jgi:hypothetical protein